MHKKYIKNLNQEERAILSESKTEAPFSGKYNDFFSLGIYACKACNIQLFESDSKFNSNCGWPSFDDEIKDAVTRHPDYKLGYKRIEICCAKCGGHLGHVFEGEKFTDKNVRHCVNSLSLIFKPNKK